MQNVPEQTPETAGTGATVVPADAIQVVRHGNSGRYTLLIAGKTAGHIWRSPDCKGFWLGLYPSGLYWKHGVNSKTAIAGQGVSNTLEPRFKDALALAVRTLKEHGYV